MTRFISLLPFLLGVAFSSFAADGVHYGRSPFVCDNSSVVNTLDCDSAVSLVRAEVRGAMKGIGERRGLSSSYWGLSLNFPADTVCVTLRHGNTDFGDLLDRRYTVVTLLLDGDELCSEDVGGFSTASGEYNSLAFEYDVAACEIRVSGGAHALAPLCGYKLDTIGSELPTSFSVWSHGQLNVSSISWEYRNSPVASLLTSWTPASLDSYISASGDPLEGYWSYLDRENDPDYARMGGRYLLAMVKSADVSGGYDILYIDGAEVMAKECQPLMRKGRLRPTIFMSHFDLEWVDSTFADMTDDIHASVTDNAILTLSFPLLKTTMRFSKVPR